MRALRESIIQSDVDGVPVIMTEFGYKTFSMVVKSLGYFTHRTSPTYFRTEGVMETKYGQPAITPEYPKRTTDYIVQLYEDNDVKNYDCVVIGPGLEVCCYMGRALNVPVLPSQFIASSPDLAHVEQNSNPANCNIIGFETDWPALCIWVKPNNLGDLYKEMLARAKTVIIVSLNSGPNNHLGTRAQFRKPGRYILDLREGGTEFQQRIGDPSFYGYQVVDEKIPHWEFAMECEQIVSLERYCLERGKNTVMISTGDWLGFIPALLFKRLYEKNQLRPAGITYHHYWACHPFYESEFLRIPVIGFEYGADVYVREFGRLIAGTDFVERNGEYLVCSDEFSWTSAMNPAARFESWGFPTRYRTDRPYDIWRYGWDDFDDVHNPTREWIVPQLKGKKDFRVFQKYVDISEFVSIIRSVKKTDVHIHICS